MIVAIVWPSEETRTDFGEESARRAGRFIAAAGHALLLSSMGELSKTAAHAYRAAKGPRLIGLLDKTESGPDETALFDETICGVRRDELPGRAFQLAGAVLFMGYLVSLAIGALIQHEKKEQTKQHSQEANKRKNDVSRPRSG